MENVKPYSTEVRARGQMTIPKKVREAGYLEEGQSVSIIPLGDSLLVTPKALKLDDLRREIRRMMKNAGVSLQDLLDGLSEERDHLYRKSYGRKKA